MNMRNQIKSIIPKFFSAFAMAAALAVGGSLTSCVDEIIIGDNVDSDGLARPAEPSLQFDFDLVPMGDDEATGSVTSLDHGEAWENYIDPSKLRILFFDRFGKYLFEVNKDFVTSVPKDSWTGTKSAYRVTIPRRRLFPDYREGMSAEENAALNEDVRRALMGETDANGEYIRDEDGKIVGGIKVAVLANWPVFVEGHRDYDNATGDPTYFSYNKVDADLHMKYVPGAGNGSYISDICHSTFDNVYGVKRMENGQYDTETPADAYKHICKVKPDDPVEHYQNGGRMDVYSLWVNSFFTSQADAEKFIRQGIDKDNATFTYKTSGSGDSFKYTDYSYHRFEDDNNQHDMENIWRLWNFSAGTSNASKGMDYTPGMSSKSRDYWEKRNTNALIYRLKKVADTSGNLTKGFDVVDLSTKHTGATFDEDNGNLKLPTSMSSAIDAKEEVEKLKSSDKEIVKAAAEKLQDFKDKSLHFRAYGEGTLHIKAAAGGAGQIIVMTKIPNKDNSEALEYYMNVTYKNPATAERDYVTKQKEFYKLDPAENKNDIPTEGYIYNIDPKSNQYVDVYIGSWAGTVNFYEIEYIRDYHIYDTARTCIMPSADNPIPMYGVQNFDAVGDFICPDETFNMSQWDKQNPADPQKKYVYKDVYLLRSVAKVEVLFDRKVFKNNVPSHVMMRVLNRSARCAPKDLKNPTEWVWFGARGIDNLLAEGNKDLAPIPEAADRESFPGYEAEWNNIIRYGHLYTGTRDTNKDWDEMSEADRIAQQTAYRNKTSWFHGIWTKEATSDDTNADNQHQYVWNKSWDWNESVYGYKVDVAGPNTGDPVWPRILNTRVDRSDYCRMHYVSGLGSSGFSSDQYVRYMMYIPEKNIDDADDMGYLGARPKVTHIEVRFDGMSDFQNFDDDNCYRIYFMNYNDKDNVDYAHTIARNGWDNLEYDHGFLRRLQPIMRNCHYIFKVNGINSDHTLNIKSTVCGSANRNMAGHYTFN